MGLRILAQYERRNIRDTYHETLRVDGQGLIPRAGPGHCVQINLSSDPNDYRFPLPPEFNRQGYFVVQAADLPVAIPYEAGARVAIIGIDRHGEKVVAESPVRYRTV